MQNKNKLKILFLTDNFPPEVNAPATRTYEHCKEWVKEGIDVTVITGFPNFPVGKVLNGYKNKLYQKENIDGIKIIRVWTYITANKGFLKRTLDYFSFAVSSFIAGLFVKSDIIIATSPQFFTTWSAYLLSKVKRKPWIFEVRDLWPESIQAVGALKNKKLIEFLEKIELGLYRNSSTVVVLTEAFKENISNRGINPDKIFFIPNGSNLELFKPKSKNKRLLKDLNLENKFIVGYIGTHGMAHGLDFIIHSISKIKDKDIHFLFIGEGAEKENLINLAKKLKLNNITFLNPVSKDKVPSYLSILDVSLVPLKKSKTFETVIPSKIFESAAMEIPILLGVNGEAKKIIEKYKVGLYFEPENEKDFLEKLYIIKNDRNLYVNLKNNCKYLVYDFDRKKLAKEMLKVIKDTHYIYNFKGKIAVNPN